MVTEAEQPKTEKQSRITPLIPHQWKRGQSGNPRGRPKRGATIAEALRVRGEHLVNPDGTTAFDVIMDKIYLLAMAGEEWAIKFISERTEGRVADRVEVKDVTYPTIRIECVDDNDPAPPQAA